MTIPDPWTLLSRVRTCRVEVFTHSEAGQLTLRHQGEGTIEVTAADAEVIWQERGRWVLGDLAGIAFHNAIRWRRLAEAQALELSHLRRGASEPTFLVELLPGPDGWRATRPHQCGLDRYDLQLRCTDVQLMLQWEVASPTEPYTLRWTAPLS